MKFADPRVRQLTLNCPIDISVYDENRNLVARIIDGVPQEVNESYIAAYVDENGQKKIVLPADGAYSLEINATGDGEVSYQIQDMNIDEGKVTHLVSFYDVPIAQGDTLTAPVQNLEAEAAAYSLRDAQGKPIEADLELSGSEIQQYTVLAKTEGAGHVQGGGYFVVGEFSQLTAVPDPKNVFLGWYEENELVSRDETIRFRVEADRNLVAVFLSTDVSMKLDREYLALKYESGNPITADLALSIIPQEWEEFVEWSVEPSEADGTVISVDENGQVTVQGTGLAYAVAKTSFKGYTFTARCRFDITDEEVGSQIQEYVGINGVQLGTDSVTTELYSTDYSAFEVLLLLPQNRTIASTAAIAEEPLPVNNGIAISGAYFTDSTVAELYDLVVKDDRTLLVVPTDAARTADKLSGSFSSTVTVQIDNKEFVTETPLKVTVKKTLPKLTADAITLNPFYSGDARQLQIKGGDIVKVWIDPNQAEKCPSWLILDDMGIKLAQDAPVKGKAVLPLQAEVKGWVVPVNLKVSVNLKKVFPH